MILSFPLCFYHSFLGKSIIKLSLDISLYLLYSSQGLSAFLIHKESLFFYKIWWFPAIKETLFFYKVYIIKFRFPRTSWKVLYLCDHCLWLHLFLPSIYYLDDSSKFLLFSWIFPGYFIFLYHYWSWPLVKRLPWVFFILIFSGTHCLLYHHFDYLLLMPILNTEF